MKTILKSILALSMLLINLTNATAPGTIANSNLAKIAHERAFYETLGKICPPVSSVFVHEKTQI